MAFDPPPGRLIGFQVLTGNGTYTPTSGTSAVYVMAIGAGGGSGGAIYTSLGSTSGGGGAGAVAILLITSLATSYAFFCGTAGVAGSLIGSGSNPNGGNGGATMFASPAILTAPGGFGSPVGVDSAHFSEGGASSNAPSGGVLGKRGEAGHVGMNLVALGGANPMLSGKGASSPHGVGGAARMTEGVGAPAAGFGSGAGGAVALTANRAGAAGAPGVVLVWEYT